MGGQDTDLRIAPRFHRFLPEMVDKPSNQTRDEVLRRMLKTRPMPHKPIGKRKKRGPLKVKPKAKG
jgi:hypothetical protein